MPRTQPTVRIPTRPASLILALLLSLCATLSQGAGDPRIVVTTPVPNAVVRPGDKLHVRVDVDPSVQAAGVAIIPVMRSRIAPLELTTPPYEGDLVIPKDLTGEFDFHVAVITVDDKRLSGPRVPFNVIPDEIPARIELKRRLSPRLPKNPGDPLPDQEGTRTISVFGYYANNIRRVIRGAMYGTTYTSSNPAVATVNANGVVTPVAPGIAFITVEHKGLKAFSKVTVEPLTGSLPPIDQTANVAIQASGFRLDRTKGLYVQQLTVTNQSSLPLPVPLELVLTGLPDGVRLSDDDGVTRVVTPLGSPFKSAQFDEQDFLSPGNSFTLTLEFANDDGAAISYTPKVYTGSHL